MEKANDILSPEDALKALAFRKDGRRKIVHSFQSFGPILMGCDITITSIREKFKKAKPDEIRIAGKNMSGMSHGICVWEEGRGWLFLETEKWFQQIQPKVFRRRTKY